LERGKRKRRGFGSIHTSLRKITERRENGCWACKREERKKNPRIASAQLLLAETERKMKERE